MVATSETKFPLEFSNYSEQTGRVQGVFELYLLTFYLCFSPQRSVALAL